MGQGKQSEVGVSLSKWHRTDATIWTSSFGVVIICHDPHTADVFVRTVCTVGPGRRSQPPLTNPTCSRILLSCIWQVGCERSPAFQGGCAGSSASFLPESTFSSDPLLLRRLLAFRHCHFNIIIFTGSLLYPACCYILNMPLPCTRAHAHARP